MKREADVDKCRGQWQIMDEDAGGRRCMQKDRRAWTDKRIRTNERGNDRRLPKETTHEGDWQ